jgi:hypothetical protein
VKPSILLGDRPAGRRCGLRGTKFVLVRYEVFYHLTPPVRSGHILMSIGPTADPLAFVSAIERALTDPQLACRVLADGGHGAAQPDQ